MHWYLIWKHISFQVRYQGVIYGRREIIAIGIRRRSRLSFLSLILNHRSRWQFLIGILIMRKLNNSVHALIPNLKTYFFPGAISGCDTWPSWNHSDRDSQALILYWFPVSPWVVPRVNPPSGQWAGRRTPPWSQWRHSQRAASEWSWWLVKNHPITRERYVTCQPGGGAGGGGGDRMLPWSEWRHSQRAASEWSWWLVKNHPITRERYVTCQPGGGAGGGGGGGGGGGTECCHGVSDAEQDSSREFWTLIWPWC